MSVQEFYASHGVMTEPGAYRGMYAGLPGDVAGLVKVIQGNLIHVFWAERMGVTLTEQQKESLQMRKVPAKLADIKRRSDAPLTVARPLERRQVGNCRDFSTMLCSMLRERGVSARARCGFGVYFTPGHYEDHWVVEYWSAAEKRWIMVDPQLDDFQKKALGIKFNSLDMPRDQFVTGGQAWQMCRSGKADPGAFGIFEMKGIWFVWGDAVRDLLSLGKIEILPWDGGWGVLRHDFNDPLPDAETLRFYDEVAAATLDPDRSLGRIRELCGNPRLQPPASLLR